MGGLNVLTLHPGAEQMSNTRKLFELLKDKGIGIFK